VQQNSTGLTDIKNGFESLRSQNLLLVVPHFRVFIKDQALLIKSYFNNMTVLMPTPYFSNIVFKLPYVGRYFRFLEFNVDSQYGLDYKLISPKFFTLPVKFLRKRNCYIAAKSCLKALSKNMVNFDLMHAHFLNNGFIGARLKSLYNKPFVLTAHGGDVYDMPFRNDWYNALARFVLAEADQVITVCKFNAEKLLSLGVSSNKLHVVPNGYDEQVFRPISKAYARGRLGLPLNKKILLSVGNLVDVKGHAYLIDAMSSFSRRKDVLLIIVGSGLLKETLQRRVKENKLDRLSAR
jgi:glycosyltransferase involved in cell wall biosynthesis